MIISIQELKAIYTDKNFSKYTDERLKMKLETIETAIRKYCNNNFQDRLNRGLFMSANGELVGISQMHLEIGDTVQITHSQSNNGLYTIKEVTKERITLDKPIHDGEMNLLTKIVYPLDIIDGAVELLDWSLNKSDKADITSETISRHSVNYQSLDGTNTIDGFPSRLFGFCKKYVKGRT